MVFVNHALTGRWSCGCELGIGGLCGYGLKGKVIFVAVFLFLSEQYSHIYFVSRYQVHFSIIIETVT